MMNRETLLRGLSEWAAIVTGLVLTALGLDLFLVPNRIAAGGVSGVAVVLHHMTSLPVGGSMLAMNMVLFVLGLWLMGKGFGLRTILSSVALAFLVDGIAWLIPAEGLSDDLLISVLFGDLLTGAGMAIVFNRNASTGGTDILARILNHRWGINVGRALLIIDFSIALGAGITLRSADVAMYSLLAVLVNCFAIEAFIDTFNVSKKVLILSSRSELIARRAMEDLDRGATYLPVEGGYTGRPLKMLMMVVRPRQTARLREIVRRVDPDAFMVVSSVNQVLGRGFKSILDPSSDI